MRLVWHARLIRCAPPQESCGISPAVAAPHGLHDPPSNHSAISPPTIGTIHVFPGVFHPTPYSLPLVLRCVPTASGLLDLGPPLGLYRVRLIYRSKVNPHQRVQAAGLMRHTLLGQVQSIGVMAQWMVDTARPNGPALATFSR